MTHEDYLRECIRIATEKMQSGAGGPFGALVVKDGKIVGRGWNQVTTSNDPTAHAEVVAMRDACRTLGSFQLDGCIVYSSCEPCPMCLGAIYWARPQALYFAAGREDAAKADFDDQFIYEELSRPLQVRKIPTRQLLAVEGNAPFTAWLNKSDRIRY